MIRAYQTMEKNLRTEDENHYFNSSNSLDEIRKIPIQDDCIMFDTKREWNVNIKDINYKVVYNFSSHQYLLRGLLSARV